MNNEEDISVSLREGKVVMTSPVEAEDIQTAIEMRCLPSLAFACAFGGTRQVSLCIAACKELTEEDLLLALRELTGKPFDSKMLGDEVCEVLRTREAAYMEKRTQLKGALAAGGAR